MKFIALIFTVFIPFLINAQNLDFLNGINYTIFRNEKYGIVERNVFDIIIPKSNKPTALVIYIHGGGFVSGDKDDAIKWRKEDIKFFLNKNIAFATINYQFYKTNDSIGVGRCLDDIKHAIQFIRHNAKKYNIDREFIGVYGHSAGAGASLYLAFHDDMAAKQDTSLYGESTRIKCAGALETQATYNVFRWLEFIPNLKLVVGLRKKMFYNSMANFYGYPNYSGFSLIRNQITQKYDMLDMISPDDPPIYILNLQKKRFPLTFGIIQHHRAHALILAKFLANNKIPNETNVYNKSIKSEADTKLSIRGFMLNHLKLAE
jgi:hypothetical protein